MKLKHIIPALLAGAALLFSSCEDRLDIQKHGNMGGQENFYKTDDEAMQAVASMYGSWGGLYYNWFFLKNLLADESWCGGGTRGDNPDYERLNEYTFDTNDGTIRGTYQGLYSIVYYANLILENVVPDTPTDRKSVV